MHLIARILVTNTSKTNQKRIINEFSTSYLLARNVSSIKQQQNEKTVQELTRENVQLKQDFEVRIAQLQNEKEEILKEFGKKLSEEDKQIMLQKHEMKVQLPSEVWYDFATRIEGHQSAGNLQSFLHEHGDITLGSMEIIPPRWNVPSDRPMVQRCVGSTAAAVDLPDLPMPKNIRNFDGISLTYVDGPILDFLKKFQENNLLANVQLDIGYLDKNYALPMLDEILPLISSIYSVYILGLFDWIYDNDQQSQPLLKTMVAQTKILSFSFYTRTTTKCTWEDKFDWCCSWLYTPRDDGMPRALISASAMAIEETQCSSFIGRIKKDFLEANHPVSFFIRLEVPDNFQLEISLENNKTNEKLVIKEEARKYKKGLLISRHSSKVAKNKIEQEEKEISQWYYYFGPRRIHLTEEWNE